MKMNININRNGLSRLVGIAVLALSTSQVLRAQHVEIDGQDGSWHVLTNSMPAGGWCRLHINSDVLGSETARVPDQLSINIDHGGYGTFYFLGNGRTRIEEDVFLDPVVGTPLRVRLADSYYWDNTGTLVVDMERVSSSNHPLRCIEIAGTNSDWHVLTNALPYSGQYRVHLDSSVRYSSGDGESLPSQLHVQIDNGTYGKYSFVGNGRTVISEDIYIDSAAGSQVRIRLLDDPFTDNSGSLWVCLEPLAGALVGTPVDPVRINRAVQMSWKSTYGADYQVQWASVLATNEWFNFGWPIPGTGSDECVFDSTDSTNARFFRVIQKATP